MTITHETLSLVAGAALSLLFSYVPGLRKKFEPLDGISKRSVMAVALLIVSLAIFGLSCFGLYDWVTCDQPGAVALVSAFLLALVANQSTYQLSPASRE